MEAALAVVDQHGLEALTIRRVAEQVDAPPMSLYSHFSNKDELLDLMCAALSERMYRDQGYEVWQTEMLALCQRIRGILVEHPNWAPLLSRPAPPLSVPLRERVLKLMVADGASHERAFMAVSSVALVAIGLALTELAFKKAGGDSAVEKRYERLKAWVDAEPTPDNEATRTAVAKLARFGLEDAFEFTAHALITGLEHDATARTRG